MSTLKDTITAISTPQGIGGIAVVRVSGNNAIAVVQQFVKGCSFEANHAAFCSFKVDGTLLDEVVVTCFRAPHSYTGEDIVEISCHGSRYIQQQILHSLTSSTTVQCRLANPGEFTLRAFVNGKFNLSQAEAVADLIDSNSKASHDLAISQLRGGYLKKLNNLRDKFVELTALLELELDFSDEDVEFSNRKELKILLDELENEVQRLVGSYQLGNALKNGIPVAIVGRTNVGKSTLLNALLNEDRAIVSDIAGTTRDTVEDIFNLGGITFRFIDTAGIRNSSDTIENAGIERSYKAIQQATIVLYMVDASQSPAAITEELEDIRNKVDLTNKTFILLQNKIDKYSPIVATTSLPSEISLNLSISAKQGTNIETLKHFLQTSVQSNPNADATILTNARHYESMTHILEALSQVKESFAHNLPADLIVVDLRNALYYLGQITGEVTSDELLGTIFSRFCIGK